MKIYTKTGDEGQTGLFGGPRVAKDHPRIEAYGTVDELNAAVGVARSIGPSNDVDLLLERIQNELFDVGAELATPDAEQRGMIKIGQRHIAELESAIDRFDADLPVLKQFILPGGTQLAAHLHLARTICRRAERRLQTLTTHTDQVASPLLLVYLNRLSDLFFVLARAANAAAGVADVPWKPSER